MPAFSTGIDGFLPESPADAAIAAVAERQHGVISPAQLLALGIGRGAIEWRIANGRLHRVYKGVYAVGHPRVSREGRLLGAALSVGPDAAVSHRSAGALWGLRRWSGRIEVTAPRRIRSRDGLRIRERPLPADEIRLVENIPATSPPRTLLDLAGVLDRDALERAYEQTLILELTDDLPLVALFGRYPHARGIQHLRRLTEAGVGGMTRSELEHRFRRLVEKGRLPMPQTNIVIEGLEVDCVWPDHHLIVELDGRSTHLNPVAFERDRARDRALQAAGWRVIRITWRQVVDSPSSVARDLACILGRLP